MLEDESGILRLYRLEEIIDRYLGVSIVREIPSPKIYAVFAGQVVTHTKLLCCSICAARLIDLSGLEQVPCLLLHAHTHRLLIFAPLLDALLLDFSRVKEVLIDLYLILIQILELVMTLGMDVRCSVEHLLHRELGVVAKTFKAFLCPLGELCWVLVELLSNIHCWPAGLYAV